MPASRATIARNFLRAVTKLPRESNSDKTPTLDDLNTLVLRRNLTGNENYHAIERLEEEIDEMLASLLPTIGQWSELEQIYALVTTNTVRAWAVEDRMIELYHQAIDVRTLNELPGWLLTLIASPVTWPRILDKTPLIKMLQNALMYDS